MNGAQSVRGAMLLCPTVSTVTGKPSQAEAEEALLFA